MTTITIALSEERLGKLKELAARVGVAPEELVRISIEELLAQPEEAFGGASDYVLRKNAELLSSAGVVCYLTVAEVVDLHRRMLAQSGGSEHILDSCRPRVGVTWGTPESRRWRWTC